MTRHYWHEHEPTGPRLGVSCPRCTTEQLGPDMDTCPHCDGEGAYWDDQTGQPDEPNGGRMITCYVCEGAGIVDTSPCIGCGAPVYDHEEDCPVIRAKEEVRA